MKKSLLFLFLLVLGVTQGWAYDELTSAVTVTEDKVYQVTSTRTINGTISVNPGNTLTIYIAKGKTLTVRGTNGSARTTPGKPAIEVPVKTINGETLKATLIITGGGTLRAYGGKANGYTNYNGGSGAAPAIGGIGGNGGEANIGNVNVRPGNPGESMGDVFIRGNVTVRVA
ncbi:MAG: hypothetical protein Q4E26_06925 [Prevotellaceae bacterium]|nr:hypothetical protein [Prevotellaceae bacterium]